MAYSQNHFNKVREAQSRAYAPYSNFKVGAYLKRKMVKNFMALM